MWVVFGGRKCTLGSNKYDEAVMQKE